MLYPVRIHRDKDLGYCVLIPDIAHSFSSAQTYDEALKNAEEAISSRLKTWAENKEVRSIPCSAMPITHEQWEKWQDEIDERINWALIYIDLSSILGKSKEITITIPQFLSDKIDSLVKDKTIKSKSNFLVDSAMQSLTSYVMGDNTGTIVKEKPHEEFVVAPDNEKNQEPATLPSESYLSPSGFTETRTDLHQWAKKIVVASRQYLGGKPITAGIWAYRYDDTEHLSCDLYVEKENKDLSMTILAAGGYEFSGEANFTGSYDICVPDMAEAIHLVGIITEALGAKIKIGRMVNETNPAVLSVSLKEGQTNGMMDLCPDVLER